MDTVRCSLYLFHFHDFVRLFVLYDHFITEALTVHHSSHIRWKSDKYENQMQFATQPYRYRMQALPSEAQRGIGKRIPAVQPSLGLIWNPSERRAVLCFHRWAVDPRPSVMDG